MTLDQGLVLLILGVSFLMFVWERISIDIVAMLVLLALIMTGLLTPIEAFSGFANPAVITVWSVFIVSAGLIQTGIADKIGDLMHKLAGDSPQRLIAVTMLGAGFMSAFMNNIGAVAILLPAVISVARQTGTSPSKLLIPLAFASLMGGNMTLIGTPPNILASEILASYGDLEPFLFFDFFPTGIIVLLVGTAYMVLIGWRLLPDHKAGATAINTTPMRDFLAELQIQEGSPLVGQTVTDSRMGELYDLNVLQMEHSGGGREFAATDRHLRAGDVLLIEGPPIKIISVGEMLKLRPVSVQEDMPHTPSTAGLQVVELTLAPGSQLAGKSLREVDFRMRFGMTVMAIRHHGEFTVSGLASQPLTFGDVLLVEGPAQKLDLLRHGTDLLVLDRPPMQRPRRRLAPLTLAILLLAVVVISLGILPAAPAMLSAAVMIVLVGSVTMEEAYQSIQWKSVFLIAGMLPLGIAMEQTGTARLIADTIIDLTGQWGATGILVGIFLLSSLLTAFISNAAVTVLMVPIAIDAALGFGANPHAYVLAVVLAASTSFLTPVGHQANIIVLDAGNYRFTDYTKVGVWLNLIFLLVVVLVLPLIWPLT